VPKAPGPFPLVMNIHGGYWRAKYNLTHAGHVCAALTAKGGNLERRVPPRREPGRRMARHV